MRYTLIVHNNIQLKRKNKFNSKPRNEILPFITDKISVLDRLRVINTRAGSLFMSIALKVTSAI